MERHRSLLKRYYYPTLIAILLITFGLRVYRLEYQSLRGDEGPTYIFGTEALAKPFESLRVIEFHPPLYNSVMYGWISLTGGTEFALGFSSEMIGALNADVARRKPNSDRLHGLHSPRQSGWNDLGAVGQSAEIKKTIIIQAE